MKRAWTKKVKAVLACTAGNDALKGRLEPVQSKVKRQVRTSAMIGLAISMGASNLLLTRESDRAPASEPVSNEPQTLSMVPAITEAEGGSTNSVELEAVKSVSPPVPSVGEHTMQKGQTLRQYQKYRVDTTEIAPIAVTAASQQLLEELRRSTVNEVNGAILGKQGFTLNRLKQKKSAVNEPIVVASSLDYQVKAGDTLSAIAYKHSIPLKELIDANKLTAPDRLQINQRLTIPAFLYGRAAGQTIAVIKRSTASETAASSLANAESVRSKPAAGSQQKSSSVSPKPLAETQSLGIGGSISDETDYAPPTFNKSQLAQPTAAKPEKLQSNPYVQNLQTDIQRLQQKYYAQQTGSKFSRPVSETGIIAAPFRVSAPGTAVISSAAINPQLIANQPANQPLNPEFRTKQAVETLKPANQKRRSTQAISPVPPRAKVATTPINVYGSESLQLLTGKQVAPDLPPLAAVDTYLPKPFNTSAHFKGYIWPTKGVLTSGYGWRWGRMHKGIDIAAPIGTPVIAAAPGVVIKAGWNPGGYGKLVDIQHADGTFTRYAHNNRILVQAGQQVEQGELISEMGSTGYSTGPHLHFEVHPGGKGAVNPIAFLKRK